MPLKCGLAPATPGRTGLWPGSSDAEMDDAKARACGRAAADTVLCAALLIIREKRLRCVLFL